MEPFLVTLWRYEGPNVPQRSSTGTSSAGMQGAGTPFYELLARLVIVD